MALSQSFPADALSSKECSAKFKAAQAAGTAGTAKYADYRKAECGTGASATPAAAPATSPAPVPPTAARPPLAPTSQTPAKTTNAAGDAVFPTAISAKYSGESAGKQRMHTCLDQYNANKATNANGGLKWIEKGGGYYSQCNAHLKS
jgi:hypothetical protein